MRTTAMDLARLFRLDRHDDPASPPADPPQPGTGDSGQDDTGYSDAGQGDKPPADQPDLAAELAKWKALARKHEDQAKANKSAADKLAEIEAAQKTDAEKATERAEAAEQQAQAMRERALRAEVKALASGEFADPEDAALYLDLGKYTSDNGEIDTDTIKADLSEVLKAKPHLAKKANVPDLGQGAGRGAPGGPASFKDASADTFAAELGKYGLKTRTRVVRS